MTPALSIYLAAASHAELVMNRRRLAADAFPASSATAEAIWIHLGAGQPPNAATTLAARLEDERPGLTFVLTTDGEPNDTLSRPFLRRPHDFPRAVATFLAAAQPRAAIWIGGPIWPVLAAKAHESGIPMIVVNASIEIASGHRGVPARDLIGLFHEVIAAAPHERHLLERAGRKPVRALGPLQRSSPPLDHDEDDHSEITDALQTRPVWYAAGATSDEVALLGAAHATAQRVSHRLLLILRPADENAARAAAEQGASRSAVWLPPPGSAVFVADTPGEDGLWYRLASVTFSGGTLSGPVATRDPFEAAALGSAVVRGPHTAPFEDHFGALTLAGAARTVGSAEELGQALGDLLSPDRAAAMAHRAWAVVSEGAEATDHVVRAIIDILERAP